MLSAIVCPVLSVCDVHALWTNGWMDQDETWHAGRPRPWPHYVRCGPSSPSQRGTAPPQFSAHICCGQMAAWIKMPLGMEVGLSPGDFMLDGDPAPNGCMDQDATWYGGRTRPTQHGVRCGPSYPQKKGTPTPPNFWSMSIVAKWLDG